MKGVEKLSSKLELTTSMKESVIEKNIKILIADDYKPFCNTLKNILNEYTKLEVIGIAHTD